MQHTVTITIPETLESQVQHIKDFETFVSIITVEALQHKEPQTQHQQLTKAAQLMLKEYTNEPELTCFTTLDGEPVYE